MRDLPKIISVEQYGYWQVYLFYSTYVGILHLGLNDGIYLRYGGEEYNDLNFKLFYGEFKILFNFELIAMLIIIFVSCVFFNGSYKYIYPAKLIISWWLPQYSDVMHYICILFPVYIFEGKMALLFNTYLKVYRKENVIFKINILCLSISVIYTLLVTYIFKNLNLGF